MIEALRREYALMITSGTQLLLILVAARIQTREGWLDCLAATAVLSLFAWQSALKRLRAIRDTPTSRIASAAQGVVELTGTGRPFCEPPLLAKLSLTPCLWYRYRIENRDSGNRWRTEESGESGDTFMLEDGSGECAIDPERAEITTTHRERWQAEDRRYTEWTLRSGDPIYVIGEFSTLGGSRTEFDSRAELDELLSEWKRNGAALLAEFDRNRDGRIDMEEWEIARQAALDEVARRRREALSLPEFHVVRRPENGPYLISNLSPDRLSRRYHYWSWGHVAIFFASVGGIAMQFR